MDNCIGRKDVINKSVEGNPWLWRETHVDRPKNKEHQVFGSGVRARDAPNKFGLMGTCRKLSIFVWGKTGQGVETYELGLQLEHVSLRRQFWECFFLIHYPVLTDIVHVTVQTLATTFRVVIA